MRFHSEPAPLLSRAWKAAGSGEFCVGGRPSRVKDGSANLTHPPFYFLVLTLVLIACLISHMRRGKPSFYRRKNLCSLLSAARFSERGGRCRWSFRAVQKQHWRRVQSGA